MLSFTARVKRGGWQEGDGSGVVAVMTLGVSLGVAAWEKGQLVWVDIAEGDGWGCTFGDEVVQQAALLLPG